MDIQKTYQRQPSIELLQRQFEHRAERFPGLMNLWVLYSQPSTPLLLEKRTILYDWLPIKSFADGWLTKCFLLTRKHVKWDRNEALQQFEWLARKATIEAHLLEAYFQRKLLPEIEQFDVTRFFGGDKDLMPEQRWLVDVYQLNLVQPLSKSVHGFHYWFRRPPSELIKAVEEQVGPGEADIFYLDDVFLESAFACSNLLELSRIAQASGGNKNEAETGNQPGGDRESEKALQNGATQASGKAETKPEPADEEKARAASGGGVQLQRPNDLIKCCVAVRKYTVSRTSLLRAVKDGRLKSYRPCHAPENSPHLFSEKEVAALWPSRS